MAARDETIRYVFETSGSKELADVAKTILEAGDASEETERALRELAAEFGKVAQASTALKKFTEEKARLNEIAKELEDARAGLAALNTEFSSADKSSSAVNRAFTVAERSIAKLTEEQSRLQVEFAKTQGTLAKAGLDAEKLATAETTLAQRSAEAAARLKELNEQTQRGGRFASALKSATDAGARGFKAMRDAVNDFASSLLRVTGISSAVTAAIGAISGARIFGGAVRSAREFEQVMSEVQAVSGATAEQLEQLKQAAEAVSANTKFSATEAAQGLGELARATGSAEAAMAALPATMQLAQAAGYGVAESATLVTTTLTQFGLAVDQAGRVADVLAKAANATTADVQGLGNSLSYAAPLAKQLNMSFEETTAVIGAMADQGFRGERAGTALRNVFSELLDPTSKFKQQLAALGIQADSFSGVMDGLANAGDRGKEAIMSLDAQARPAILALVADGGSAIRSLQDDLHNAAGAAEETARTMGANFDSAWLRMGNAFDQLRRALIQPLLDPFIAELDNAATRIRNFVASADFGKVKAAVSEFATNAARAMREFVDSIDFAGLAERIREFVSSASDAMRSMSESAGAVGTTLKAVGNGVAVVWNGLQTAVMTAAGVIVGSFVALSKAALTAAEGISYLNNTHADLVPTFERVRDVIGGLEAVTEEFSRRASKNAGETAAAWRGLSDALSSTSGAAKAATGPVEKLTDGMKVSAEQADALKQQFALLPDYLQRIVAPSLQAAGVLVEVAEAAVQVGEASTKVGDAIESSQDRLARAVQAYAELARSGTATADQLRAASIEIAQATTSLGALGAQASDAAKRSEELKAAFATLGVSSQQDLQATADAASSAFGKIAAEFEAGVRPIEDVRAAFGAYAKAQLDAVANSDQWKQKSVRDMLEVKAAALGLNDVKLPDFKKPLEGLEKYRKEVEATGEAEEENISHTEARTAAIEASAQATERAREMMASFTYQLQGWGEKAIETFQKVQDSAMRFLSEDTGGAGLRLYIAEMNRGVRELNEKVEEQQRLAEKFMEQNAAFTEEQLRALMRTSNDYDTLIAKIRGVVASLDMLDAQTLSQVRASAEALENRIEAIRQRTESAIESFLEFAASAKQELASMEGDYESAEYMRYKQELERLREQAEAAGALDSAAYKEAVKAAEALHKKRLENIRSEAAEREKAEREQAEREKAEQERAKREQAEREKAEQERAKREQAEREKAEQERAKREQAEREQADRDGKEPITPRGAEPITTGEKTLKITLNGEALGSFSGLTDAQLNTFVTQKLMPAILKQLETWRSNSGDWT